MATEREPPRLQRRNVEVLDSDCAVIAGTSFISRHLFRLLETVRRVLAVWYSPVGRVL